ncbi:hypothetical protein CWE22_08615 [Pseudidiomarina aestuarii]|uniref:Uncharacterized protein n=1 Tax=Pseudidiomarina aestuarii TaxID=624146 RepID=A0A7Z6ZVJ3_9GAMM|nr:hypothetical protein [Pseudidiomarina aestuarii]RUO42193.1 hypothetical protein CWE22_08615 [Pseudidiomarina aestuarii]
MLIDPFRNALLGKPVSHVWVGYGSALFVEFGSLTTRVRRDGTDGNPVGEFTLMIEWSWRIEKPRSILGGSCSSERRWPKIISKLLGGIVQEVDTFGALPEIQISLSNGLRILSFMTDSGQPDWALLSERDGLGTLFVKSGRLCLEKE